MKVLSTVPESFFQIILRYGNCGMMDKRKWVNFKDWEADNLRVFQFPAPLRQSWDHRLISSFTAHRKVGEFIVDALAEIVEFYGLAYLRKNNLDLWGGCYNPRLKRGSSEPSTHSWGIAVDYCPDLGKMGEPTRIPWPIVEAFLKRGFENFPKSDGMHFQAAKGY